MEGECFSLSIKRARNLGEFYRETCLRADFHLFELRLLATTIKHPSSSIKSTLLLDKLRRTALHLASKNGHNVVVQYLVEQGTKIDSADEDERTALHLTSENGPCLLMRDHSLISMAAS